jgi:hypothetical protein
MLYRDCRAFGGELVEGCPAPVTCYAGSAYVAKEAIGAYTETRAASRDCALSYLLDLEK